MKQIGEVMLPAGKSVRLVNPIQAALEGAGGVDVATEITLRIDRADLESTFEKASLSDRAGEGAK